LFNLLGLSDLKDLFLVNKDTIMSVGMLT